MSLVLEALKKLDREKGAPDRGFVVMAATPWPARAARRGPAWAVLLVAVGAAAAAVVMRAPRPSPPADTSAVPALRAPASRPAMTVAATAAPATLLGAAPRPPSRPAAKVMSDTSGPADTAVPSAADHGLRLQAISERDGQPVALVNDRLLRVGDEVDGAKVLAIRGTEVDVEVHGRRATLHF